MLRVLVCAATRAEHRACLRGALASGSAEGAAYEVMLTGVGGARAGHSLRERLARGAPPDLVVSAGLAGALSTSLSSSSWITGARLAEWNGAACVPVAGVALVDGPRDFVRCEVISSSALVSVDAMARAIEAREREYPVVVDMESAALGREAARSAIPFSIVRMIGDTPRAPLPAFLTPLTAAMAETRTRSRLTLAARGLRGALADPHGAMRLMRESTKWLRELEEGWRMLAAWPS